MSGNRSERTDQKDNGVRRTTPRVFVLIAGIAAAFIMITLGLVDSHSRYLGILGYSFSAILGILTAIVVRKRRLTIGDPSALPERRVFLCTQQLFSTAVLATILLMSIKDWKTSEASSVSIAACVGALVVGGALTRRKEYLVILLIESVLTVTLFLLPAMGHYATYHGRDDLFFHLGIADKIVTSGVIPSSMYNSWPLWHIGVTSTALICGTSTAKAVFIYVGAATCLAIPFVFQIAFRLSGHRFVGAISATCIALSPAFLTWLTFLTPTVFCYGLFAVMLWAMSRRTSPKFEFIAVIFIIAITLSHHLSPLIVLSILVLGTLIQRNWSIGRRRNGELNFNPMYPLTMAVFAFAQWLLPGMLYLVGTLRESLRGLDRTGRPAEIHGEFSLFSLLISFAYFALLFFLSCGLFMQTRKHTTATDLGRQSLTTFTFLALLSFIFLAQQQFPGGFFGSILISRWALYGWFFAALVIGFLVATLVGTSHTPRTVAVAITLILFVTALSSVTAASSDTLPFSNSHFGVAPRPYLLQSETELVDFACGSYEGEVFVDLTLCYYIESYRTSDSIQPIPTMQKGVVNTGAWIIRTSELQDRGLEFGVSNQTTAPYFAAPIQVWATLSQMPLNLIADTGTTQMLTT